MLPYFIIIFVPFVSSILYNITKQKCWCYATSLSFFILLFVMLAFRNITIGTDLTNYQYFFNDIAKYEWKDLITYPDIEVGYVVLNKLISSFTSNFQIFLTIVAFITVVPIAIVYIKESSLPFLSIVLFVNMSVFPLMFSGLRQAIAISIGTLAYFYIKNKSVLYFLFFVILAASFHISALVLLLMYPLYYYRLNKSVLFITASSMIMIYILREDIFTLALPLISKQYALKYLEIEYTNAYNMLYLLISFAIFSFIFVKERTASITIKGMRNILLFALFIQIFASINTIVMRMGYYYLLFIPLLIPMVIRYGQRFNKEVLLCVHLVLIVFFTGYFFFNVNYGADILNLYPYEFFWD